MRGEGFVGQGPAWRRQGPLGPGLRRRRPPLPAQVVDWVRQLECVCVWGGGGVGGGGGGAGAEGCGVVYGVWHGTPLLTHAFAPSTPGHTYSSASPLAGTMGLVAPSGCGEEEEGVEQGGGE